MKKFLCLFGALFVVLMVNAQKVDWSHPVSTNHPFSWLSQEDLIKLEKMVPESARSAQPRTVKKSLKRVGEAVDTLEYYAVAQSTTSNYQYAPNGGDILPYNIGIAREGNQV